ncbi:Ephrin type-A receptor 4 [Ceratobasidium sp. AG-Ba]|nr:Ephrin type-A receptor 4 [Ceratobasidium sp. AG-Ba]
MVEANVLVSSTGVLKLADFGNTKLKEQTLQFSTATTRVYSLRWAAPEILHGSPCSFEADIYALGMSTQEIVTGTVPYADKSDIAVMVEVVNKSRFPSRNDEAIRINGDKNELWNIMINCWYHDIVRRPKAIEVEAQLASMSVPHLKGIPIYSRSEWRTISKEEINSKYAQLYLVGDGAAGKSCVLDVLHTGSFPESWNPRIFEDYYAVANVARKQLPIRIIDTTGLSEYKPVRAAAYRGVHLVLVCFAIDSPDSLENVQQVWMPEVRKYCPSAPLILVGCKMDLRRSTTTVEGLKKTGERPVTYEEGLKIANDIGALCYLECSARTGEGMAELRNHTSSVLLFILSHLGKKVKGRGKDKSECVIS